MDSSLDASGRNGKEKIKFQEEIFHGRKK